MIAQHFGWSRSISAQEEGLQRSRGRDVESGPLQLGPGDDVFLGSDKVDDWVYGQGGEDRISGNGGDDILHGGAADDSLSGGKNRDRLFGGTGDDHLSGGDGHDVLVGGTGTDVIDISDDHTSDRVVFKQVPDSLPGSVHDTIGAFATGQDHIDLRKIDADPSTSADDAFTWIGGKAFDGVAGELRYDAGAQLLQGDVTGDGVADFEVAFSAGVPVLVVKADIFL